MVVKIGRCRHAPPFRYHSGPLIGTMPDAERDLFEELYLQLGVPAELAALMPKYSDLPKIDWEEIRRDQKDRARKAEEALIERIANLEHQQWCFWVRNLIQTGRIPGDVIARWNRSLVPYAELPDEVKEHDRKWARLVIEALRRMD